MSEFETLDWPLFSVEEGIKKLREIEIVEQIFHLRLTHPPWEGPEDIPFTITVRNMFVRGAPETMKNFAISLLL